MSKLELRGVLVPSDYDTDWTQKYIERGILTPESYFRRNLAAADTGEPLELYINSPGGSVFAAYEMINAVREWKMAAGQPVNVTLGALAASAASVMAIMVADGMRAHANTKMMFHGAYTITLGGSEMHADTADLLAQINADAITRLVSRYNIDPEIVAQWFAEGRVGWLSATALKQYGIIEEVIGADAEAIDFPAAAVADIEQRGIGIAALLESNAAEPTAEGGEDDGCETAGDGSGEADEGGAGDTDAAPADGDDQGDQNQADDGAGDTSGADGDGAGDEQPADAVDTACAAYAAGVETGRIEAAAEHADAVADLQARLTKAEGLSTQHQSARDKLAADIQRQAREHDAALKDMAAKLAEATKRLEKLVAGSLTFTPAVETWEEAMAACGGDYEKARREYGQIFTQHIGAK